MTTPALRIETQGHVATVVLSRPEVRNAFNDEVIAELSQAFVQGNRIAKCRQVQGDLPTHPRGSTASNKSNR